VIVFDVNQNEVNPWKKLVADESVVIPLKEFSLATRNVASDTCLDIIVYSGLGMSTAEMSWAFTRLAPVTAMFWGHPHTSGLPNTVDYFISSDHYEPPVGGNRFSEQLVRFDSLNFYFHHPKVQAILRKRHEILAKRHLTFGENKLPEKESGKIILIPQTLYKFHPKFDEIIVALLEERDDSTVVITYNSDKPVWKDRLARRLKRALQASGIKATENTSSANTNGIVRTYDSRVVFLQQMSTSLFWTLMLASDVLLDPFPFGGGTTSLEAFALCRPVVTLPDKQNVPQLTAGMYRAMKMDNSGLIASDVPNFLQKVLRILEDKDHAEHLSNQICQKNHILFENKETIREWESFLSQAVST